MKKFIDKFLNTTIERYSYIIISLQGFLVSIFSTLFLYFGIYLDNTHYFYEYAAFIAICQPYIQEIAAIINIIFIIIFYSTIFFIKLMQKIKLNLEYKKIYGIFMILYILLAIYLLKFIVLSDTSLGFENYSFKKSILHTVFLFWGPLSILFIIENKKNLKIPKEIIIKNEKIKNFTFVFFCLSIVFTLIWIFIISENLFEIFLHRKVGLLEITKTAVTVVYSKF